MEMMVSNSADLIMGEGEWSLHPSPILGVELED